MHKSYESKARRFIWMSSQSVSTITEREVSDEMGKQGTLQLSDT